MIYEPYTPISGTVFLLGKNFIIDNVDGCYYFANGIIYKVLSSRNGTNQNQIMGTVKFVYEDHLIFEFDYLGVNHSQTLFFKDTAIV